MCLVRQLAAIYRTCYQPDESTLLRGINTSLGCRTWTWLHSRALLPQECTPMTSQECTLVAIIRGINTSLGCRTWTNADNFTALYCFCDSDLCNAATARTRLPSAFRWVDVGILAVAAACFLPGWMATLRRWRRKVRGSLAEVADECCRFLSQRTDNWHKVIGRRNCCSLPYEQGYRLIISEYRDIF